MIRALLVLACLALTAYGFALNAGLLDEAYLGQGDNKITHALLFCIVILVRSND